METFPTTPGWFAIPPRAVAGVRARLPRAPARPALV